MVHETGGVEEVDGEVVITSTFSLAKIPATLQDLLMARLDRMDANREVMQLGAALGREFTHELIEAVWPDAEALPSDQCHVGRLGVATAAGGVRRVSRTCGGFRTSRGRRPTSGDANGSSVDSGMYTILSRRFQGRSRQYDAWFLALGRD